MTVNRICTLGTPATGTLPSGPLKAALLSFASTAVVWGQRARDRAHLRDLEDRFLDDIAMTREQRDREVRKPFWVR